MPSRHQDRQRGGRRGGPPGSSSSAAGSAASAASTPHEGQLGATVVFGGSGFVGRYLVHRLRRDASRYSAVVVADLIPPSAVARSGASGQQAEQGNDGTVVPEEPGLVPVTWVRCDVSKLSDVQTVFARAQAEASGPVVSVFHLAAIVDTRSGIWHKNRLNNVNVRGTANVIEVCKSAGVQGCVFLSSTTAVMERGPPPGRRPLFGAHDAGVDATEVAWNEASFSYEGAGRQLHPISAYGTSKRDAEAIVLSANGHRSDSARHPLTTCALRPNVVFGVGDTLGTEPVLSAPVVMPRLGPGTNVMSVIYVKNLIHWLVLAEAKLVEESSTPLVRRDALLAGGNAFFVSNGADGLVKGRTYYQLLNGCRGQPNRIERAKQFSELLWWLPSLAIWLLLQAASVYERWFATLLYVPRFMLRCLAIVMEVLDFVTFGRLRWKALLLTRAACDYTFRDCKWDITLSIATFRYSAPFSLHEAMHDIAFTWNSGVPGLGPASLVSPESRCSAGSLNPRLAVLDARSQVFSPLQVRGLRLRNRVVRMATHEALCEGGVPTDRLITLHQHVSRGGAAMTTVAYAAVSPDGRSFASQLLLDDRAVPQLRRLTDAVHRHGGAASVQLTHAGYFAKSSVTGKPVIGVSNMINPAYLWPPHKMTRQDINRVVSDFEVAARKAVELCGFDCVELHCGHGYLLSQFISPHTNTRSDEFGGSLKNRLKVPLMALAAVRRGVGSDVPIAVKFNIRDGFSGGLEAEDSITCAQAFEQGGADILTPSGGFVTRSGLFMLRGPSPLPAMAKIAANRAWAFVLEWLGPWFARSPEFTEQFFEQDVITIARSLRSSIVMLQGGVVSLERAERALLEHCIGQSTAPMHCRGVALIGMARALIREPDMVQRALHQVSHRSGAAGHSRTAMPSTGLGGAVTMSPCDHCNRCVASMELPGGMLCANLGPDMHW